MLKSRGTRGATQEELEQVVSWAEQTRAEAAILEEERRAVPEAGKTSPRAKAAEARHKELREEGLQSQRTQNALHQALLEEVLAGRVLVDVDAEGELLFVDASANRDGS
jgi:lipid II:glycine glycyltransferase (peptidoglycan interpeptide bridge formation enzyme)